MNILYGIVFCFLIAIWILVIKPKAKIFERFNNDTASGMFLALLVEGIACGMLFVVEVVVIFLIEGSLGYIFNNILLLLLLPVGVGVFYAIAMFGRAVKQAAKDTKATKKALNQMWAKSGTPLAAQAKQELAAENAKEARNAVIKGAVVGGIVAGQTGAIVGAVAAKAEVDSKNNADK